MVFESLFLVLGETRDRNGTSKETGGSREGQGGQRGCKQERENEADEGTGNKKNHSNERTIFDNPIEKTNSTHPK